MDIGLTSRSRRGSTRRDVPPVVIALCLSAGPAVALAFTRFAYALLLPPMRSDLGWTFAIAGGITASNAVGYLVGAATTGLVARRIGERRCFIGGMAVAAATLLLTSLASSNYVILNILRAVGGYATAVVFIVGAALASTVAVSGRRSSQMVSVYMSGVGVGIVLAGIMVPWALAHWGERGWREGWIILGMTSAALLIPAVYGAGRCAPGGPGRGVTSRSSLELLPIFVWYILFGAGYVTYMTFVAALLKQQQISPVTVAAFFVILGIACVIGTTVLWGRVLYRLNSRLAPAVVSSAVALGILPILLLPTIVGTFVSAIVFGLAFMAGPAVVTIVARRALPQETWTAAIGMLTVAFSLGQAIGPMVSGVVADGKWGISGGFWISVAMLAFGTLTVLVCRCPANARGET